MAAAAGVATETLYAHFSSKRGLLEAAVNIAVVGDDRPVPLAERPEFVALGRGRLPDRAAAAARLLAAVHGRTAGFAKVVPEAASSDDEIAAVLREARERQRRDVAGAAELIMGRESTAAERDGLWALHESRGLPPARRGVRLDPRAVRGMDGHDVGVRLAALPGKEGSPTTIQSDAPADTRMMRIVHQALRRELRRAQVAMTSTPPPSSRQQHAIARHLTWMMGLLRGHHRSEDAGLYPLVRQRDSGRKAR